MKERKGVKIILIHTLVWLTYIAYELLTIYQVDGITMNLWETFLNFILYAILFYTVSLYLLPHFFQKKKYFLFVFFFLLTISVFILVRYFLKVSIVPLLGIHLTYPFDSARLFIAESLWRGIYFVMLSVGFWTAKSLISAERAKRILQENEVRNERKLREMEASFRQAEIEFLKNQINPHFLFNTLNFFYDQVRSCSESTAEGVLILANIMRYALKESDVNAKVMLEDEVKHLQNFISINQLRFGQRLQVQFEIEGSLQFRMIIPLILITFVENCFKYGDLFDPQNPLLIKLEVKRDELFFKTHNKKKIGPVESSNGIGLENTHRRLDLVYGERYSLDITDEANFFTSVLKIQL